MSQKQAQSLPASRRKDVKYIFDHYASGADSLHAGGLLRFLQMEQAEPGADDAMAENLIDKYEIDETERKSRTMTFPGFLRYMESRDCSVLNQEHTRVYQDMGRPLCHYFISSSHNTYLTADQLVGKSHLFAYESALRKGCRCLEIDCWDGPDLEPIVYHGYTLTSKILFRDVISTIAEHAFQVSPYPVILSLENHCHLPQQQVMAQYITTILGDKLLDAGLDLSSSAVLPSPQCLEKSVESLIKNKNLGMGNQKKDMQWNEKKLTGGASWQPQVAPTSWGAPGSQMPGSSPVAPGATPPAGAMPPPMGAQPGFGMPPVGGTGAPMMPQMFPQPMMRPQFPGAPGAPLSPGPGAALQSPKKPPTKDPLADLNIKDFL